jgi:phage major head subunit gpT-like protein
MWPLRPIPFIRFRPRDSGLGFLDWSFTVAISVNAFTTLAREEFMRGKIAAEQIAPAKYEDFTTRIQSTVRTEAHTFMSTLPRLVPFKGYTPASKIFNTTYYITNNEYRVGPIEVKKTDLDDDQTNGYLTLIQALPEHGQRDIGFTILSTLRNGTSNACFDGSNFFATSHNIGAGNNLQTFTAASGDGKTYRLIFLIKSNPVIKPIFFQEREPLSSLLTTADTPQAMEQMVYDYWCDCRFGVGYGFWWDACFMTITNTPTYAEMQTIFQQVAAAFRAMTLPPGASGDTLLYVHEGWVPTPENFLILCDMQIAEILRTFLSSELVAAGTGGGVVTNTYRGWADYLPTSALNS